MINKVTINKKLIKQKLTKVINKVTIKNMNKVTINKH